MIYSIASIIFTSFWNKMYKQKCQRIYFQAQLSKFMSRIYKSGTYANSTSNSNKLSKYQIELAM